MKPASEMDLAELRDEIDFRRANSQSRNLQVRKRADEELTVLMADPRAKPTLEEVEAWVKDLPF